MKKDKPFNGGQWTVARKRSFIMSALRQARWPVKYACIKTAFVKMGTNPKTGRKCKLHRCPSCKKLFPQKDVQADHIKPIIPLEGFDSWDSVIDRIYCELDGFQVLCKKCHSVKTKEENKIRREKRAKK